MNLKDVTLVCVEGVNSENALKVLRISRRDLDFGKVKLVATYKPKVMTDGIEYEEIPSMTAAGYNKFILRNLNDYIDTKYCVLIQTDGFIINPQLWDDEYLKYDYIGAPWKYNQHIQTKYIDEEMRKRNPKDVNLVGNGGFSFRSKKLLEETANCPVEFEARYGLHLEDIYICVNNYDYFIDAGIKFAPVELANKFSNDPINRNGCFGFHGNKQIIDEYKYF